MMSKKPEPKIVWIVGKYIKSVRKGVVWEFGGVFSEKMDAIKCAISKKNENYFVAPAELNKDFPEEKEKWEGSFYPQILKLWYDYSLDNWYKLKSEQQETAEREREDILKAYNCC